MTIEPNAGGVKPAPVPPATQRPAAAASSPATALPEPAVSLASQALRDTLKQSSQEVRPEKVARAQALANDPSYPSEADLDRLAGFLAKRL